MAISKVKSTYSLDAETVRMLAELARKWRVSKSEALRRIIRAAAADHAAGRGPVDALEMAQKALDLSADAARLWAQRVRSERRTSSQRLKGR